MKKLFFFYFLSLTSIAFGGIDEKLDSLEKEMQEISARNPQNTLGASFTSARPENKGTPWFVTIDLIYWHTKMGGTDYAYSFNPQLLGHSGGDPIYAPNIKGDMKLNDMGWNLGLKAGIGYKTPHDSWDVFLRYTYFNADHSTSSTKPEPSGLMNLLAGGAQVASKAKSHVEVDYNTIDLELARSFFISSQLAFRTHIDLQSTWINIDQKGVYNASTLHENPLYYGLDIKSKQKEKFWGLGPRAGVDSQWFLGYGFHFFGDLAGSIQYGYFKTNLENLTPPVNNSDNNEQKLKQKFHRFIPSAHVLLGLGFGTYMNEKRQHLTLRLGYEVQYIWRVNQLTYIDNLQSEGNPQDQNELYRIGLRNGSEDLMFYGITGSARLDF